MHPTFQSELAEDSPLISTGTLNITGARLLLHFIICMINYNCWVLLSLMAKSFGKWNVNVVFVQYQRVIITHFEFQWRTLSVNITFDKYGAPAKTELLQTFSDKLVPFDRGLQWHTHRYKIRVSLLSRMSLEPFQRNVFIFSFTILTTFNKRVMNVFSRDQIWKPFYAGWP